jgi:hypothetical protein
MTDADTISATVKPNEDGEKQGKEEQNSEHVGHNVAVQYDLLLLFLPPLLALQPTVGCCLLSDSLPFRPFLT